ncbi:MAG: repair protein SbcD/Mre11 [Clostridia bacterium]|nr:repair protein SbcD/Mre11 [Clostridia bacterium]
MGLKIIHTSDLHIGMKFNGYPDYIRSELIEARFKTLKNLIETANEENCNLFVVAGDLFEKITIQKKDIERVIKILEDFAGDCVLVLPGNHDYDNGMVELWQFFRNNLSEKIVLLNENKVYDLRFYDLDVAVYPASCNRKNSNENNLGWMNKISEQPEVTWHIGVAHGALEGLSPDMHQQYFYMTKKELESIPVDLWLLGHTHIPYPEQALIRGNKIFNAGTPEPDGMDCSHEGHAWLIEIDKDKKIEAKRINTGIFKFIDTEATIEDMDSFEKLKQLFLKEKGDKTLLRLKLKGRIDQDLFKRKEVFYKELTEGLAYFDPEDSQLGIKITGDVIDKEFTAGSFPHQLLTELYKDNDEEALQIAYEVIQEAKV